MSGGVVAVFAHPDDESLLAGGVLAGFAASGSRVAIVSLTRGELGPGGRAGEAGTAELAQTRVRELEKAAEALGASSAECLGFRDGELDALDLEQAVEAIGSVLERERPDTVIGFSEEGLYWHPDHVAAARFVGAALGRIDDQRRPRSYGATWPKGHAGRLAARMRERRLPTDLWGIDPDAFGAPAEAITASIDVRQFLPAKLAALREHRSQIGPAHLLSAMPDDVAEELLGREYFVSLAPEQEADGGWLAGAIGAAVDHSPLRVSAPSPETR
jgi:N-acetyl-1-D-myo-inositol-2-amino-2-deoxy-alpha-D-glucopyranoside deacetylase